LLASLLLVVVLLSTISRPSVGAASWQAAPTSGAGPLWGVSSVSSTDSGASAPFGPTARPSSSVPSVLQRVALGREFSNGSDCEITEPLPVPVTFPAGTTQLAFQVGFDYTRVRSIRAIIDGDLGGPTTTAECNKYVPRGNWLRLTQIGATVRRSDGLAFKAGFFQLRIFVDNRSEPDTVITFEVKARSSDSDSGDT
jgi:hypothetical protein